MVQQHDKVPDGGGDEGWGGGGVRGISEIAGQIIDSYKNLFKGRNTDRRRQEERRRKVNKYQKENGHENIEYDMMNMQTTIMTSIMHNIVNYLNCLSK